MLQKSQNSSEEFETVDILLCDADYLVTCDNSSTVIPDGALAIINGKIYDLGPSVELRRRYRAKESFSLKGHILMPGLINAHVHVPMSLFRGLADDLPLEIWLSNVIFPAEARWINERTVYLGSLLSFSEMLLSGVTCFCDGYFFEDEVVRAAKETGIRGIAGQGVLDHPTPDSSSPDRAFERAERFLSRIDSDMVRPSLFCHAPYTCSGDTIRRVKGLCRSYDVMFQIHLAETEWERRKILELTGKSPAGFLEDLGILDDKTLCVHGVWLDGKDLNILRDNGAGIVHCPESNLKLGSGIADLPSWIDRGLRIGIGTDGPASNNNLDILGEMGMIARLHKGVRLDTTVCSSRDVLRLGTIGGATAIGMGGEIGSIEKGKKADCVALSVSKPHSTPLYDPVSHIVYSSKASDVKYVWVDGIPVVREGRLVSFDIKELFDEIEKISGEIKRWKDVTV